MLARPRLANVRLFVPAAPRVFAQLAAVALDALVELARRAVVGVAVAAVLLAVAAVDGAARVRRVGALDAVVARGGAGVHARVVRLAQVHLVARCAILALGRNGRQVAHRVDLAIRCVGRVGDAHSHVPGEGTVAHATDTIKRSTVRCRLIHPCDEIRIDALAVLEVVLANRGLLALAGFFFCIWRVRGRKRGGRVRT